MPLAQKRATLASCDEAIRGRILEELAREAWAPLNVVDVTVASGSVELRGSIVDERRRQAVRVLVENVPGVKEVGDQLVFTAFE